LKPPALLEIIDVSRTYQGLRPLRIKSLVLQAGDRVAVAGLDALAAEVLVNLITGALLPDTGVIRVAGESTASIATDTAWLSSLDRFGFVSHRTVLLEGATAAQNMTLPFTLEIDPIPTAVRAQVDELAAEVGLAPDLLEQQTGALSGHQRLRVHLAKALAVKPALLLLEHPTAAVEPAERQALGEVVARAAVRRGAALLALTQDPVLAAAVADRRLALDPASGALKDAARKRRWW
jgi:ABC-type lipoprotein export system ATPase subunit